MRLIDEAPRAGIRGSRVAFLHPSASGGVLTETRPTCACTHERSHEGPTERPPRRARLHRQRPGALAPLGRRAAHRAAQGAAGRRERWYEVEATDGAVLVDLGQVAYLRVESGEHRVGF